MNLELVKPLYKVHCLIVGVVGITGRSGVIVCGGGRVGGGGGCGRVGCRGAFVV